MCMSNIQYQPIFTVMLLCFLIDIPDCGKFNVSYIMAAVNYHGTKRLARWTLNKHFAFSAGK